MERQALPQNPLIPLSVVILLLVLQVAHALKKRHFCVRPVVLCRSVRLHCHVQLADHHPSIVAYGANGSTGPYTRRTAEIALER